MDNISITLNIKDVDDLTVEGVDRKDYPDFCDAFFDSGSINGRELTEQELDDLSDKYPEIVNEMAFESLI